MLRYLALASAIVLASVAGIAGWIHRDLIRIRIASVYASARPKPEPTNAIGGVSRTGLQGDAPWALSALPECFTQTSHSTGPRAYALAHLPAGATPVAPPARLAAADCTIVVTGDGIYVRRGADRFRIPPPVRLYRARGALAVLQGTRSGGNDLRVYEPTEGSTLHE